MVFIETERLVLRNTAAKDADSMFDYRSSEICAKYQRGQTKELDGIRRLIEHRQNDVISVDAPFMLSAALKQSDEMIGEIVDIILDIHRIEDQLDRNEHGDQVTPRDESVHAGEKHHGGQNQVIFHSYFHGSTSVYVRLTTLRRCRPATAR